MLDSVERVHLTLVDRSSIALSGSAGCPRVATRTDALFVKFELIYKLGILQHVGRALHQLFLELLYAAHKLHALILDGRLHPAKLKVIGRPDILIQMAIVNSFHRHRLMRESVGLITLIELLVRPGRHKVAIVELNLRVDVVALLSLHFEPPFLRSRQI